MSQQDVKLRLAPGETKEIQRPGRFIFCKFSDRQVSIIMDQARIEMEAGDKHVSTDRFKSFQVQNLDQEREAYLIFVVGDGDFDRMIVQGEISIEPILRNADGTTKPDTRFTLEIDLLPVSGQVTTLSPGDVLAQVDAPYKSAGGVVRRPDGIVAHTVWTNEPTYVFGVAEFDDNLNLIQTIEGQDSAVVGGVTSALTWSARRGYLTIINTNQIVNYISGNVVKTVTFSLTAGNLWSENAEGLCVDKNDNLVVLNRYGNVVVIDSDTLAVINEKILPVYSVGSGIKGRISYNRFNDTFVVQTNNNAGYQIYDANFQLLENLTEQAHFPNISQGRDFYRNLVLISEDFQTSGVDLSKVVFSEYQTSPKIEAVRPFCGLNNTLLKRSDPLVLTASITATETPNGIQIEGELIKAALEYYYRTKVPDDYLDHIYGFDVSRDKNGYPVREIVSGNRTFKAANIADDLTTLAPSRVKVILDNELQLGANL